MFAAYSLDQCLDDFMRINSAVLNGQYGDDDNIYLPFLTCTYVLVVRRRRRSTKRSTKSALNSRQVNRRCAFLIAIICSNFVFCRLKPRPRNCAQRSSNKRRQSNNGPTRRCITRRRSRASAIIKTHTAANSHRRRRRKNERAPFRRQWRRRSVRGRPNNLQSYFIC